MAKRPKLTPKRALFCKEYLIDLSATRAAIRAGYSEKSAGVTGYQLLQQEAVMVEIQSLMDARAKRTEITADRVLKEYARVGFVDPRNIMQVDENGNMTVTASDLLSSDDAVCVSEIQQTVTENGGSLKIKLHNKMVALEKMGRHLKLFTDVQEVKHTFTQMGRVTVGSGESKKTLEFNIGEAPNTLESKEDG